MRISPGALIFKTRVSGTTFAAPAQIDATREKLVEGLSIRLTEAGIPVHRISLRRPLMRPVIGITDVTWTTDARHAE